MKGHEKVLFIVNKYPSVLRNSYFQSEIVKSYIFRTRQAARAFAKDMNSRSKKYKYSVAFASAVWGPDN